MTCCTAVSYIIISITMKASKELKIGIFVTVVLILSFVIINFLREKDIFNRDMEVSAVYGNACGLTVSAPVMVMGYKAGSVTDIFYESAERHFKVTCSVMRQFDLPADSRMEICSMDIMGGKGVEIIPGTSAEKLSDGDIIEGTVRPDLLSALGENIVPVLDKVSVTVDSLRVAVGNINSILGASGRQSVASSLLHLERTMANAEKISAVLEGRSEEMDAFIGNLAAVSDRLVSVMERADTAMTGINGVVASLDSSDIGGLVCSFNALLEKIQDPDGTLGKLLYDGKVYDSLDSLLSDADSLVRKIGENPRKYIRISVF